MKLFSVNDTFYRRNLKSKYKISKCWESYLRLKIN